MAPRTVLRGDRTVLVWNSVSRRCCILVEHFNSLEGVLAVVFAKQVQLVQDVVRGGDNMTAYLIRLHNVQQLSRAGPQELSPGPALHKLQGVLYDGQRIHPGIGDATGKN